MVSSDRLGNHKSHQRRLGGDEISHGGHRMRLRLCAKTARPSLSGVGIGKAQAKAAAEITHIVTYACTFVGFWGLPRWQGVCVGNLLFDGGRRENDRSNKLTR